MQIKRGLINNKVNVDGEDVRVSQGYLKPALKGFGLGSLLNAAVHVIAKEKPKALSMLTYGSIGALTALAATEAKRRKFEEILNKNPEVAKRLAKKDLI